MVVTYGDGRDVKNPHRKVEIVEKLQNYINPKFFNLRLRLSTMIRLYAKIAGM